LLLFKPDEFCSLGIPLWIEEASGDTLAKN